MLASISVLEEANLPFICQSHASVASSCTRVLTPLDASDWGNGMLTVRQKLKMGGGGNGCTVGVSQTTDICISPMVHNVNILSSRRPLFSAIYVFVYSSVVPHVIKNRNRKRKRKHVRQSLYTIVIAPSLPQCAGKKLRNPSRQRPDSRLSRARPSGAHQPRSAPCIRSHSPSLLLSAFWPIQKVLCLCQTSVTRDCPSAARR
jgi:hypothetical protein